MLAKIKLVINYLRKLEKDMKIAYFQFLVLLSRKDLLVFFSNIRKDVFAIYTYVYV